MAIMTKGLSLSDWGTFSVSQKEVAVSSFLQRVQDPNLQQLQEQYQSVCDELDKLTSSSDDKSACFLHDGLHLNTIIEELMIIKKSIHEKIQTRSESLQHIS